MDSKDFDLPSSDLMKVLAGELIVSEDDIAVITLTHGFSGLIRKNMSAAYDSKERKPGDICVTDSRGWPQINIVGSTKGEPQLVWLEEMQDPAGDALNSNKIISHIAGSRGSRVNSPKASFSFAQMEIDGRSVFDPESPIRIIENKLHLPQDRKVRAVAAPADAYANDVGTAFPTQDVLSDVTGPDQVRYMIEEEAKRLQKTVDFILDPTNAKWVTEKSRIMKAIITRYAKKNS